MVVFGGELWPLGNGIAFVELPLLEAVATYQDWGDGWASPPRLDELGSRPLRELLRQLLPFEMPYTRRLLVGTESGWTAIFDNSRGGGDPFPATHLATAAQQRAVAAIHVPESQSASPATQFHLFGPTGEPPLRYVRTIDAGRFDSGRWEFMASGAPQPFEDITAYNRPKIRDRFTRAMLLDYLAALGIRADDPSFYTTGVLATETGDWSPTWTATLAEARAAMSIE